MRESAYSVQLKIAEREATIPEEHSKNDILYVAFLFFAQSFHENTIRPEKGHLKIVMHNIYSFVFFISVIGT